ncbi:hypothetical protein AVEN_946-1 [Araneus ventricosus]|uniref:Uncharacterized protein n=1 Tax=Araneus ventricosus TaxID=182803 RepID=A0A4Y2CY19_ARAVE|nr:hypothetical protein AVEN_946-1 [Araneus ventricosus]
MAKRRLRHLAVVQNYEVRPKTVFAQLRNGKLKIECETITKKNNEREKAIKRANTSLRWQRERKQHPTVGRAPNLDCSEGRPSHRHWEEILVFAFQSVCAESECYFPV